MKYCNHCREYSVTVKVYTKHNGEKGRVEFCLNKGCGYSSFLPFLNVENPGFPAMSNPIIKMEEL